MSDQTRIPHDAEPSAALSDDAWLVRPATVRLLGVVFVVALVLSVLVDLVVEPKAHFGIDGTFAFYAWYGFLACLALVLGARILGSILGRSGDYYDD